MNSFLKETEKKISVSAALFILRFGVGVVFLSFGVGKLIRSTDWILFIPSWLTNFLAHHRGFTVQTFLHFQGIAEVLIGFQLILGVLTRWTAAAAAVTLLLIIYSIGFDPIGIRDTGLFFSSLAILILGPGDWSIDAWSARHLQ